MVQRNKNYWNTSTKFEIKDINPGLNTRHNLDDFLYVCKNLHNSITVYFTNIELRLDPINIITKI